jgi:ABC-type transporter Mla subunit MlaD
MTDRHIGYLALAILAITLAITTALVARQMLRPTQVWTVRCEQIGTLKLADPVVVRGVQVGQIVDIRWDGHRAMLAIRLSPPRPIYADYGILIADVGIMGDRLVILAPGTPEHRQLGPDDTLKATFVLGPSEALGMVTRLRDGVAAAVRMSRRLAHGDSAHEPLINRYARLVHLTDSLSERMLTLTLSLDRTVTSRIDTLSRFAELTAEFASRLSRETGGTLADIADVVTELDSALVTVEELVARVENAVAGLDSPEVHELRQSLDTLHIRILDVKSIIDTVREGGAKLRVWPF